MASEISRVEAADEYYTRRQARKHLLDFTQYTYPEYEVSWHHELLCEKLDEFAAKKIKRLMISIPPQNGKTELASRRFPAFIFGQNPDAKIIACSYSADLAFSNNRDLQLIIDSPKYSVLFPETRLNSSNLRTSSHGSYRRTSDLFDIVGHKGGYRAAGVGGGITGMGMDYGIIDDPYKNREEAESKTIRKKVSNWYTDVFYTRQRKDAGILLIMTRWHKEDIAGELTDIAKNNEYADDWEIVSLPALSDDEPLAPYDKRTGPNQPLWPNRYSLEFLLKTKATVPTYTWLSLYQQRPSAAKGNIFERLDFLYFKESPLTYDLITHDGTMRQVPKQSCIIFQTCDPAGTAETYSDYFVLSTWALTPKKELLLLDVFRTKLEGADHMQFFKKEYLTWLPTCIGFESASIGKTTYQNLVRGGYPVLNLEPKGDKFSRALSAAIRLKTHTIYFKFGAPWLDVWIEELLDFPKGHDDQVDTISYADYLIVNNLIKPRTQMNMTWQGEGISEAGMRM